MSHALPFGYVSFDGKKLDTDPHAGRRLRIDARCLDGQPARGAYASICAVPDHDAALRFDEPEVQQARRDALAWWIPLLGDELICISTFALDASRFAGAVTATRSKDFLDHDPFSRLFPATVVQVDFLCPVPAPPGPVIERYAGAPWPGGTF